jgi:hypothetical protein
VTHNPLLGPVVVLVSWTLVMLVWLAAARLPKIKQSGVTPPPGSRGVDFEKAVPGKVNWPAHNYAHLHEQPTLFYAIVLTLVALGDHFAINLYLAWGYVGLRIIHSLVQATSNVVRIRFTLFMLATLCLAALTLHAAISLAHG